MIHASVTGWAHAAAWADRQQQAFRPRKCDGWVRNANRVASTACETSVTAPLGLRFAPTPTARGVEEGLDRSAAALFGRVPAAWTAWMQRRPWPVREMWANDQIHA